MFLNFPTRQHSTTPTPHQVHYIGPTYADPANWDPLAQQSLDPVQRLDDMLRDMEAEREVDRLLAEADRD